MNKTIASIIAITFLISLAIWKGIDGVILAAGIAAIAGLGGFVSGRLTRK